MKEYLPVLPENSIGRLIVGRTLDPERHRIVLFCSNTNGKHGYESCTRYSLKGLQKLFKTTDVIKLLTKFTDREKRYYIRRLYEHGNVGIKLKYSTHPSGRSARL